MASASAKVKQMMMRSGSTSMGALSPQVAASSASSAAVVPKAKPPAAKRARKLQKSIDEEETQLQDPDMQQAELDGEDLYTEDIEGEEEEEEEEEELDPEIDLSQELDEITHVHPAATSFFAPAGVLKRPAAERPPAAAAAAAPSPTPSPYASPTRQSLLQVVARPSSKPSSACAATSPASAAPSTPGLHPAALSLSLEPAAQEPSHAVLYKQFLRSINNPEKFPAELEGKVAADKKWGFKMWLEHGKDWLKVQITCAAGRDNSTEKKKQWNMIKAKDIDLGAAAKEHWIAKCNQFGWWQWDPMAPNNEDEKRYLNLAELSWTERESILGIDQGFFKHVYLYIDIYNALDMHGCTFAYVYNIYIYMHICIDMYIHVCRCVYVFFLYIYI